MSRLIYIYLYTCPNDVTQKIAVQRLIIYCVANINLINLQKGLDFFSHGSV